jgi:hypothetical protein
MANAHAVVVNAVVFMVSYFLVSADRRCGGSHWPHARFLSRGGGGRGFVIVVVMVLPLVLAGRDEKCGADGYAKNEQRFHICLIAFQWLSARKFISGFKNNHQAMQERSMPQGSRYRP